MNIAYISYEYPPDTSGGGIATYVAQAARIMAQKGHDVEVFAASQRRSGLFSEDGVKINLVPEDDRKRFAQTVLQVFSTRHAAVRFDVVESPDFEADGRNVRRAYPELPHLAKLHCPHQLLNELSVCRWQFRLWLRHHVSQVRCFVGALRRLKRPSYKIYDPNVLRRTKIDEVEKQFVKECDHIVSPSISLKEWAIRKWTIPSDRINVIPNPYVPSAEMLKISSEPSICTIGYFGRLQQLKGIDDLIEAIPCILAEEPGVRFRFVGKSILHPLTLRSYDLHLKQKLKRYMRSIELVGYCPLKEMAAQYEKVSICVFPSIWENFPNVCLEAMSAGRPVVGSNAGGMFEMLDGDKHGISIPPRAPKEITKAVVRLIRSPELRKTLGESARQKVLQDYSIEAVGPMLEASYKKAIRLRAELDRQLAIISG